MRYIYHQSWCCWSQPGADNKYKWIFLLPFLALVNLNAVWGRSGRGVLFKLYLLVRSVKEACSFSWRVLQAWRSLSLKHLPKSFQVCKGRWPFAFLPKCRPLPTPKQEVIHHLNTCGTMWIWHKSPIMMGPFILNFGESAHGSISGWNLPWLSTCMQV